MLDVLTQFLSPSIVLFLFLGVVCGIIGGCLPGISPSMTIALLLPISLYMPKVAAITLLLGAYQGAMFGGSISAILINAPGTAAAAATVLDGYQMAQKGETRKALDMALYASCTGGFVGCIILLAGAQGLSIVTLKFGPPEYFALMVMSLVLIAGLSGKSLLKGLLSAGLGLGAATVGIEQIYGARRFTFGNINLMDGFSNLSLFIGLFAFSEILAMLMKSRAELDMKPDVRKDSGGGLSLAEYWKEKFNMLVSGVIGAFIGILPGIGGSTASFLAYAEARRRSKNSEQFGTGILSGVAAPEAANNAVCGGALVPMLTLGIPGDVVTAVLIGALIAQGIKPGPLMFSENIGDVYIIYIGLLLSVVMLALVGTVGVPLFSKILNVKKSRLYPLILVICIVGTFAYRSNYFDCITMVGFGVLGYILKRGNFPIPPMVIAFVIGAGLENSMRQSLIISQNGALIFLTRPICVFLFAVSLAMLIYMVRGNMKSNKKSGEESF
jgi:putative tricarboxylic transport membrane protein